MLIIPITIGTAIIVMVVILLRDHQNKPTAKEKADSYYDFLMERDKAERKMRQEFENDRIERVIEVEAQKLFSRYKRYAEWEKATEGMDIFERHTHPLRPDIYIWNPLTLSQIIYDEETMKFKDTKAEVLARLEKLKADYKQN